MKKQIFRAVVAGVFAALTACLLLTTGVLYSYFQGRVTEELEMATVYIARGVERGGRAYLEAELPTEDRITWVDDDGNVLYDNWQDAAGLENHAGREEIALAAQWGRGTAVRYSDTLGQKAIYCALRLEDGTILRLAAGQDSVWTLVLRVLQPMLLVSVLALCLALWLAVRLARKLVAPINAMDLSDPQIEEVYEELSPLVGKIRSQNYQIGRQVEALRRQQKEFAAVTDHMREGLLVIDRETRVLSCNAAAVRLLGAESCSEGESVLSLNREVSFRRCVEEALAGRPWEEPLEKDNVCCRVFANPVKQDGALTGAVLVIMDVTEKEQRETLRREFTANVSHELKTPLTSILGTAEIIKGGLVRPEDLPHFAGNIHREAQRLIDLVNDIIKVSRLDEGGPTTQWETVDLRAVAERVREQLTLAAEQKGITLNVRGTSALVRSVPRIVEEVIYNLCDNAVAYNVPGGRVDVTVVNTMGARVIVADTGIGIPREAQDRVFERFYRVDKSHSGGGTGLGLSIVKHGAAYLGARVEVESKEGKGSTFTLTFPSEKR